MRPYPCHIAHSNARGKVCYPSSWHGVNAKSIHRMQVWHLPAHDCNHGIGCGTSTATLLSGFAGTAQRLSKKLSLLNEGRGNSSLHSGKAAPRSARAAVVAETMRTAATKRLLHALQGSPAAAGVNIQQLHIEAKVWSLTYCLK